MSAETYQEYLQSRHWATLKSQVPNSDVCAVCGSSRKIHIHHQIYRKSWYDTLSEDLIPLCKKHHILAHKRPFALTLAELIAKVNKSDAKKKQKGRVKRGLPMLSPLSPKHKRKK